MRVQECVCACVQECVCVRVRWCPEACVRACVREVHSDGTLMVGCVCAWGCRRVRACVGGWGWGWGSQGCRLRVQEKPLTSLLRELKLFLESVLGVKGQGFKLEV